VKYSKTRFAVLAITLFSSVGWAHVTVWPRTASNGGFEKYTVRVPTEGNVATTAVELMLPEGVTFVAVAAPVGHAYQLKKSGERVSGIVWTMKIAPGEFAEFSFMARNPKEGKSIVWKAVQTFADGTKAEWVGPPGDKRPASVTQLSAGEAGHAH